MNDYKARAQDDLKIAEAMPRSFWQGRAIRKIINGYEFLIFLDRVGFTGVCIRPESSTQQKDYILIGIIDQNCRYDRRQVDVMNELALNHGWTIPPISVKSGYNDGLLLWAGRWNAVDHRSDKFRFRNFQEFNDSVFYEITSLYKPGRSFISPKNQVHRSITERKFYIV